MQTPEVAVHERIAGLCLIRGTFGKTEVPLAVFLPRVGLEESVLCRGVRLHLAPVAREDVLAALDKVAGPLDGLFVDDVGRHPRIVTGLDTVRAWRGTPRCSRLRGVA